MSYGQANAAHYLIIIGVFVISSYLNDVYLQLLSSVSFVVLTLSIVWGAVSEFIDWFDKALEEWKKTL